MKFNWFYLVIAIIVFSASVSVGNKTYNKWLFVLVMLGILFAFGDKILPKSNLRGVANAKI